MALLAANGLTGLDRRGSSGYMTNKLTVTGPTKSEGCGDTKPPEACWRADECTVGAGCQCWKAHCMGSLQRRRVPCERHFLGPIS